MPDQYHAPEKSSILTAKDLGIEHALSGSDFDPPYWVRDSPLFMTAYTRGFNSARQCRLVAR